MEHETDNNKLIFNFVRRFSSFESALRMTDSIKKYENANIVWNDVKALLKKNDFALTLALNELEIIKNPPKKLRFNEGLSWELGEIGDNDENLAVDVLVRIRNNLFHGSKRFGDSSESERNRILISDALVVLDHVIKGLGVEDVYENILSYWN